MKLPTKSKFALESSVDQLPRSANGNLYLWTFTFVEVLDVPEAKRRWSNFLNKLRMRHERRGKVLNGLRVFELHKSHGLHIDVVTGRFLHVSEVRSLWRSCGGGRIHVLPVPPSRAKYVAKYIRKAGRPECLKSARLWDLFGGFEGTRIKDVTVDSNATRIYRVLVATLGLEFKRLPFFRRFQAVGNIEMGRRWDYGIVPAVYPF